MRGKQKGDGPGYCIGVRPVTVYVYISGVFISIRHGPPRSQVCLESLGLAAAGAEGGEGGSTGGQLLVTACNHGFHIDCVRRLPGPLCPVCRYNHDTISHVYSTCSEVGPSAATVCTTKSSCVHH
jgi:hypothetical protein